MRSTENITRLLIAAGGTGGHIYPGLAIAREFAARHPDAEISFVGTQRGLEGKIIGDAGFEVHMLRAEPLRGGSLLRRIKAVFALLPALSDARRLLTKVEPDAVVGVGGYISGPLLLAASRRGIPTMILEPNYDPGLANKLLARFIDRAAVAWQDTAHHFRGKAFVSGNPIRPEIAAVPEVGTAATIPSTAAGTDPSTGEATVGVGTPATMQVLLFGGSQGSRILNDAMIAAMRHLPNGAIQITHQTGPDDLDRVRTAYAESNTPARVEPYLPNMDEEYARSHIVVARAGATTCAELAAAGRGAILVPLELAAGHQRHNADALQRQGAAIVIKEAHLTGRALATELAELAKNPDRYIEMGKKARANAKPEATARIVDELEKLLGAIALAQ